MAEVTNIPTAAPIYVDVNTLFGINARPELLNNVAAINNSLYNLMSCPIGQRPFLRAYGSRLPFLLQEPADEITASEIRLDLYQSIRRWEPRITLDSQNSSVALLPTKDGFAVELFYTINNLNVSGKFSVTLSKLS